MLALASNFVALDCQESGRLGILLDLLNNRVQLVDGGARLLREIEVTLVHLDHVGCESSMILSEARDVSEQRLAGSFQGLVLADELLHLKGEALTALSELRAVLPDLAG